MPKRPIVPAAVAPTLAEQKSDFTAEGAPPPGKVATDVPATPKQPAKKSARRPPTRLDGSPHPLKIASAEPP